MTVAVLHRVDDAVAAANPVAVADDTVAIRPAAVADCERVWQWNFDPEVRRWSHSREHVPFVYHVLWYANRLERDRGPMWIIEDARCPVGVVRIDAGDDPAEEAQISIAIASDARGHGVGRRAIAAACRAWGRSVSAEINTENRSSRSCFEACGFRLVVERDGFVTYRWEPQ